MKDTSRASTSGTVGGIGVEAKHGAPSLNLATILGYNGPGQGSARNNVIWHPDTGLFGFSCGRSVVLEDLVPDLHTLSPKEQVAGSKEATVVTGEAPSRQQTHMFGPTSDITLLCASPDGHIVAAAEEGHIWLWDSRGRHIGTITHEVGVLQTLAFGPKGKFLVAIGSYASGDVLVWDMADISVPCASLSIGVQEVGSNTPPLHAIDMMERVPVNTEKKTAKKLADPDAGGNHGSKRRNGTKGKRNIATRNNSGSNKTALSFVAVGGRTVSHWRLQQSKTESKVGERLFELQHSSVLDAVGGHRNNTEYFTAIAHCKPLPTTLRFAVGGKWGLGVAHECKYSRWIGKVRHAHED